MTARLSPGTAVVALVVVPLLGWGFVVPASAYSSGAGSCSTPSHGASAQSGDGGFSISLSSTTPTQNDVVAVTLSGGNFKGFLLTASDGQFQSLPAGTQSKSCGTPAVTHTGSTTKTSVQVQWKACGSAGTVTFSAVVVSAYSTWYGSAAIQASATLSCTSECTDTVLGSCTGGSSTGGSSTGGSSTGGSSTGGSSTGGSSTGGSSTGGSSTGGSSTGGSSTGGSSTGGSSTGGGGTTGRGGTPNDDVSEYEKSVSVGGGKFSIHWTLSDTTLDVALYSGAKNWAAIGLGSKTMKGSDMVIGFVDGGTPNVNDYYASAYSFPGTDTSQGGTNDLEHVHAVARAGGTVVKFTKRLQSADSRDASIETGGYHDIVWAHGELAGTSAADAAGFSTMSANGTCSDPLQMITMSVSQHSSADRGAAAVNWVTGDVIEDNTQLIMQASHGAAMGFAWVILVPVGLFVPLFLKPVLGRFWFYVHTVLMIAAYMLTLAAAPVAVASITTNHFTQSDRRKMAHSLLGLVVIAAMLSQPVTGLVAHIFWILYKRRIKRLKASNAGPGDKPLPRYCKTPVNYVHYALGRAATVVSVPTVILGAISISDDVVVGPAIVGVCYGALVLLFGMGWIARVCMKAYALLRGRLRASSHSAGKLDARPKVDETVAVMPSKNPFGDDSQADKAEGAPPTVHGAPSTNATSPPGVHDRKKS